jgi:hypothetical protein
LTQDERVKRIQKLIAEYRVNLAEDIRVSDKFEISRLPTAIQNVVQLVVADTPAFSNIAALLSVNYSIAQLIGQLRPVIDDSVYSRDRIGINTYNVLASGSGSGKSSSINKLADVFQPASYLIETIRQSKKVETAKTIAFDGFKKANPSLSKEDMQEGDYTEFIGDLPRTTVGADSTRG